MVRGDIGIHSQLTHIHIASYKDILSNNFSGTLVYILGGLTTHRHPQTLKPTHTDTLWASAHTTTHTHTSFSLVPQKSTFLCDLILKPSLSEITLFNHFAQLTLLCINYSDFKSLNRHLMALYYSFIYLGHIKHNLYRWTFNI